MHKNLIKLFAIGFAILAFWSCGEKEKQTKVEDNSTLISRDLDEIIESDTLKVLITYSSTSYFLYRGHPMGFEYEILERLADELGVGLELILVEDMDSVFDYLNEGKADLVAHGMAITLDRKEKVDFTNYLYLTSQVLVQRKPDNWRQLGWANIQRHLHHDAIDLLGDTVSIRANSSYLKRVKNLSKELGDSIYVDTLPGTLSTEEILKMVAEGEIEYTVADKNLATISAAYYPNLDISVPLSLSQRLAWAVRKNSPKLLGAINEWIEKEKDEATYYVIYNRYFKNKRDVQRRIQSDFMSLTGNQISMYDDLIKDHSEDIGWDWRLVASLVYQESRFDANTRSWAGAEGLMQLMPATARTLGVSNPRNPQQSIRGGTKYLGQLYERFDDIEDSVERVKCSMAAYNCGFYHVRDAQFLAKKKGLDHQVWDDNIERMLIALSYPKNYNIEGVKYGYVRGAEPVKYVDQIFERYDHYRKFID